MVSAVELKNDFWRVSLLPSQGAAIASGEILHKGNWLNLLRPTEVNDYQEIEATASFPLIPWSNRIANGKLRYKRETYQLRITADDGTTLHGPARDYPWQIVSQSETELELHFTSSDHPDFNFPWPISATIRYRLTENAFTTDISITNLAAETIPVGLGHHPYFLRGLADNQDEALLTIYAEAAFPLENALPTGPASSLPELLDFRAAKPLGDQFINDVLSKRSDELIAAEINYPKTGVKVTVAAAPVFEQIVLYTPVEADHFALEPVSNTNNPFELLADAIPGHGLTELAPNETVSGSFSLIVS